MYQPVWQPEAPRSRPAVVSTAALLMGLLALLGGFNAISSVVAMGSIGNNFRDLAERDGSFTATEIDQFVSTVQIGAVCGAAVTLALALGLAALAIGLWRGSQAARVITWVVCGLGLLCACCGGAVALSVFADAESSATSTKDQVAGELLVKALPDWLGAVTGLTSVVQALAYLIVIILLALPAASAFFRKQPGQGANTMPPYPQHPQYPTQPPPTF